MRLTNTPLILRSDDLRLVQDLVDGLDWLPDPPECGIPVEVVQTVFSPVRAAEAEDLSDEEFLALTDDVPEGIETGRDGRAWTYWAGDSHVVAASKERAVLRPHGHIARASVGPRPEDRTVASTAWMGGTFASQLSVGHACAEPLLSVRRSYLGLKRAEGLRILVREISGTWHLLGTASAWIVDGQLVRWIYRWRGRRIEIRSRLTVSELMIEVDVRAGAEVELLIVAHSDSPVEGSEDGILFADGRGRGGHWSVRAHPSATHFTHSIPLGNEGSGEAWTAPRLEAGNEEVRRLDRVLQPFLDNALVHYQSPRGLEQFTGGAWGTRDVCQGPVGLLIATGRYDILRDVLLVVYAAQQSDGNWPQSFQYLEQWRDIGHQPSHGDIVYWPLLALGEYLEITGDTAILTEEVAWMGTEAPEPASPLLEHVRAAVDHVAAARSQDPRLPAYGHGDWNDALQPANSELARSMCSTWTAELEIKALETLAPQLRDVEAELAARLARMGEDTRAALHERLIVDGELCGYSIISDDAVEPLVHPSDRRTGIQHGSLQVIHALADELLEPDQAKAHLAVVDAHLDGPTGIYLFDRPLPYQGGVTRTFLRAEAASFWGREIGLMYAHAHVRWVQALLRLGLAERAWHALQLLVPDALRTLVPGAAPRQSNCYYSSSDAGFADRYDAQANADRLFDPEFRFEGGWRVYSSGPGLILRMLVEDLLGCKWTAAGVHIDPVVPSVLDGTAARLRLGGRDAVVTYRVNKPGHGVDQLKVNGHVIETVALPRRYRRGGVTIPRSVWGELPAGELRIDIRVGGA